MSFHDVRFPPRISYGAVGGPRFSTTVQILNSGHEQRNMNWAHARREYSVDISPSRGQEWEQILNFFHARRGRAYAFRLKDFSDFRLKDGPVGTGNGARQDFQIVKIYQDEGEAAPSYTRSLTKIVSGSVTVYLDGVAQFGNWSVNDLTGILHFTAAPVQDAVISVSCDFDVPVRFDTDLMEAAIPGPDIHDWQSVKMVEVRQ